MGTPPSNDRNVRSCGTLCAAAAVCARKRRAIRGDAIVRRVQSWLVPERDGADGVPRLLGGAVLFAGSLGGAAVPRGVLVQPLRRGSRPRLHELPSRLVVLCGRDGAGDLLTRHLRRRAGRGRVHALREWRVPGRGRRDELQAVYGR